MKYQLQLVYILDRKDIVLRNKCIGQLKFSGPTTSLKKQYGI
jgi:hypothetical protein